MDQGFVCLLSCRYDFILSKAEGHAYTPCSICSNCSDHRGAPQVKVQLSVAKQGPQIMPLAPSHTLIQRLPVSLRRTRS